MSSEIAEILQRGADGGRISTDEALLLYTKAPFHELGEAANEVRKRRYPDGIVTYLIDRNINYTNVCVTACKFCAFYRAPKHSEGWSHDLDEVLRRCAEAVDLGATQVMLQGGHHPDYGVEYYEEMFSAVTRDFPQLAIHSIGPSEIGHMAKVSDVSIEEAIKRIKAAGLDSIAGAGAEMLPERPRKALAPLKESGERWCEIMELAHQQGLESTATMMMGTGETNAERIEHLRMIRDVHDRTGGFRAFIPWTYQPENNKLKGHTQATTMEYLRMLSVARLYFNEIAHLQSSWLTTGKAAGQVSLHMGVDDLGSIMLEENVISSAGARHRSNLAELIDMIRAGGRIPAQRNTLYEHLDVHYTPDDDPTDTRVRSHVSSIALPVVEAK